MIDEARQRFTGTIMQVPPMFSAVKVEGQRAYAYARTDDPSVVIAPKPVEITGFEITAFRPGDPSAEGHIPLPVAAAADARHLYDKPLGSVPQALPQLDFRIHCGKGTYIRSIARDFGTALGSGAFLSALRREAVGDFSVQQAVGLDEVESFFL